MSSDCNRRSSCSGRDSGVECTQLSRHNQKELSQTAIEALDDDYIFPNQETRRHVFSQWLHWLFPEFADKKKPRYLFEQHRRPTWWLQDVPFCSSTNAKLGKKKLSVEQLQRILPIIRQKIIECLTQEIETPDLLTTEITTPNINQVSSILTEPQHNDGDKTVLEETLLSRNGAMNETDSVRILATDANMNDQAIKEEKVGKEEEGSKEEQVSNKYKLTEKHKPAHHIENNAPYPILCHEGDNAPFEEVSMNERKDSLEMDNQPSVGTCGFNDVQPEGLPDCTAKDSPTQDELALHYSMDVGREILLENIVAYIAELSSEEIEEIVKKNCILNKDCNMEDPSHLDEVRVDFLTNGEGYEPWLENTNTTEITNDENPNENAVDHVIHGQGHPCLQEKNNRTIGETTKDEIRIGQSVHDVINGQGHAFSQEKNNTSISGDVNDMSKRMKPICLFMKKELEKLDPNTPILEDEGSLQERIPREVNDITQRESGVGRAELCKSGYNWPGVVWRRRKLSGESRQTSEAPRNKCARNPPPK